MLKIRLILACLLIVNLTGCASVMKTATGNMANNLTLAMMNQNDLETVKAGAPAYLLMIDSLIEGSPYDANTLLAGSKLYSSYAAAFVKDEARSKRFADKSLSYAKRALCKKMRSLCTDLDGNLDTLKWSLKNSDKKNIKVLYGFATAQAGWIQANSSDWNAIALLPQLTALFERVLAMDESYDNGGAHLYMGVLSTLRPRSLGGEPEVGRKHFERAQQLSNGKNLMVNVFFAKHYARLVFNKKLHDHLLVQVLEKKAEQPTLTLINTLAKIQAKELLMESDEYF